MGISEKRSANAIAILARNMRSRITSQLFWVDFPYDEEAFPASNGPFLC
jgi:hypothetical protein